MTYAPTLLQQLVPLVRRPIATQALERAQLHLLDWLGCAAYGGRSEVAGKLRDYLARWREPGSSWCFAGADCAWQDALLYNAALGNIAEMDDLHRSSTLHPGPVIVPAALALAERLQATPQALLESIVIGYEVTIRIGRAMGRDHYALYHNTSTCGSFGAAAAAAHLLGLDDEQLVWALGNAGTRTGGFWQMRHESTDSKQLHCAEAARTGVQAALLAAESVRGPASLLEGTQGLFAATSPEARPQAVIADAAGDWLIFQCSFKPWPACRHTHPAIDATLELGKVDTESLESVQLRTYRDALVFCDRPTPATPAQARFSLQHCAAVVLLYGRPALEHFEGDYLVNRRLAALRERILVTLDDDLQRRYPAHFGAAVTVQFSDGSRRSSAVQDAWGDPEVPMSETDLVDKASQLMAAGGIASGGAEALVATVLGLTRQQTLGDLFGALHSLDLHSLEDQA